MPPETPQRPPTVTASSSHRTLEALPGLMTWLAIILATLAAALTPNIALACATILAVYITIRFTLAAVANIVGAQRIREWENRDWEACFRQHPHENVLPWDAIHHLVIIPNLNEPETILAGTLDNLSRQYQASQRMTVILAMEAHEAGSIAKAERLQERFQARFANFHFTVHPQGLPGEIQSKSANQAWAARWAKRKLVERLGLDLEHIVVTTMDADTCWHEDFFYALTYLFATDAQRHLRFWQAPIRYHNNIWAIDPIFGLIHAYASIFELAYLAAPWWRGLPISSYSLSLRLLESNDYWDTDVIADEWHMFIKVYFAQRGDITTEPVLLPFRANATIGDTFWQAAKNRYLQTLRHSWGSKEIGYALAQAADHPGFPVRRSMRLFMWVSHDILLASAGWAILAIGSQLTLLLHPALLSKFISQGFPDLTLGTLKVMFMMMFILTIIFWIQDRSNRPSREQPASWKEAPLTLISLLLLPVLAFIFVTLPLIHAQTRLMLGKPLEFRVTRKR